jgi:peptidoglycan/LPS O-acetylase OafA/YrhL
MRVNDRLSAHGTGELPEGSQPRVLIQHGDHSANRDSPAVHLSYLDGMRGLAALHVTIHHALMEYPWAVDALLAGGGWPAALASFFRNGSAPVILFIVLSGYCLMIPVVRSGGHLRGGIASFARRRAWRILPCYYAALAISILLPVVIPALASTKSSIRWVVTQPVDAEAIVTHVLLIQHFALKWMYRINYPLWSVAVEWWLYVLFALVVVGAWRRRGTWKVATALIAAGIGLDLLGGTHYNNVHLRFIALFGMGVTAAAIGFSPRAGSRGNAWAAKLALLGVVVYLLLQSRIPYTSWAQSLPLSLAAGLATSTFLLWATGQKQQGTTSSLVRALEHPASAWLGRISYSLYLIHAPVLSLTHLALIQVEMVEWRRLMLEVSLGVPLSLLAGWALWYAVERPSMRRMERRPRVDVDHRAIEGSSPATSPRGPGRVVRGRRSLP